MIYTLTLNPAVDVYLTANQYKRFDSNKLSNYFCLAGGKGINVSKMLKNLKMDSICLGFVGGKTGNLIIKQLNAKNIKNDFVKTKSPTRINIKITSPKEKEINSPGNSITKQEYLKLKNKLLKLKKNDILIIGGSLSKNLDIKKALSLINKLKNKGIKLIIDTSSKYLFDCCKYKPLLVKPNIHELSNLFDKKINNRKDAIKYAKKLIALGAKNVLVSLGSKGAILVTNKEAYYAFSPKGKVISTTGCGDSMVAGFVIKYLQKANNQQFLKFCIACGSATAFSKELGRLDNIIILSNKIKVQKV